VFQKSELVLTALPSVSQKSELALFRYRGAVKKSELAPTVSPSVFQKSELVL
jgi:hypothetical protein